MLPSSPEHMPRARTERMLIARVITAVGLALLLVVGAWSTARGSADVHATLCLASGVSSAAGAAPTSADLEGATAIDLEGATSIDALTADVGVCLLAVLCSVALVLLLRRLAGRGTRPLGTRAPRTASPSRAGPRFLAPALTLTQLSISRT